jgi:hypothetical protein
MAAANALAITKIHISASASASAVSFLHSVAITGTTIAVARAVTPNVRASVVLGAIDCIPDVEIP